MDAVKLCTMQWKLSISERENQTVLIHGMTTATMQSYVTSSRLVVKDHPAAAVSCPYGVYRGCWRRATVTAGWYIKPRRTPADCMRSRTDGRTDGRTDDM